MPKVWWNTNHKSRSGFSTVEALLASALFGMIVTALIGGIVYGRAANADAGDHARATELANEGLEAVRNIRDASYAGIGDGTFGLVKSGGSWTLSGSSDITGNYTRQVVISSGGTNRKSVTANVTWPTGSTTSQSSLSTMLSNWRASVVIPKSWANAIYAGGIDIAGNNDGTRVATEGSYAYLVRNSGAPNFIVLNISNPAAPTIAGSLTLAGAPTNIAVRGNYAYVTNTSNTAELQTVNITNPAAPSLASSINMSGNADATGAYTSGNYLYVVRLANGGVGEFSIFNLTTPANPAASGSYGNNINMREVYVSGSYAYVATESDTQEVLVVNVSNPLAPAFAAALNLTGVTNATTITGQGTMVYVGQGTALRAVNITVPTAPTLAGSYTSTGTINDIAANTTDPTYIFLGTSDTNAEMQVMNVTNPAAMTLAKAVDIPAAAAILNGVAYNSTLNLVVGASTFNTLEGVVFAPN